MGRLIMATLLMCSFATVSYAKDPRRGKDHDEGKDVGTVIGAILGGAIGASAGGRTEDVIGGAIAGGVIGRVVGDGIDDDNDRNHSHGRDYDRGRDYGRDSRRDDRRGPGVYRDRRPAPTRHFLCVELNPRRSHYRAINNFAVIERTRRGDYMVASFYYEGQCRMEARRLNRMYGW